MFLKFQKNDVYKKWKFRPGTEIKKSPGDKKPLESGFLGSMSNHLVPKSVDRAEIAKNCFIRQS